MKSAIIPDDIVQHPACGRTADYEENVSLLDGPAVPEVSEFFDQLRRLRPGEPRQLIHKDYFPRGRIGIQQFLEQIESVEPVLGFTIGRVQTIVKQAAVEMLQLAFLVLSFFSGVVFAECAHYGKRQLAPEAFVNQIGFSDTTTPVDGQKLGLVRAIEPADLLQFPLSANNVFSIHRSCFCANINASPHQSKESRPKSHKNSHFG